MKKIVFGGHAEDKFAILKEHGFIVSEDTVKDALQHPDKITDGYQQKKTSFQSQRRRLCDYSIYDIGARKNHPERNNIMAEMDFLRSVPYLLAVPSKKVWADYDDEADVLYVSFHKPQQANDSIMEDNVIRHYRDKMLVGMTILGASRLKE